MKPGYFAIVTLAIIVTQLTIIYLFYYRAIIKKIFSLPKGNPKQFIEKMKSDPTGISNKKRIVFVGDSITHGNMSINFIDIIAKEIGEDTYDYINSGLNKNITYHVLQRLDEIIACKPDFVIIIIGTNDVHRSMKLYRRSITDRGLHLPRELDKEGFVKNLQKIVFELQQKTNAEIVLCSIPPIGEDTTHDVFIQCIDYSKTIKSIAEDMKVNYIPVNEKMVEYLELNPSKPKHSVERKLFGIAAAKYYILGMSLDKISEDYGFNLFIDHLHLNTKGAKLLAELIIKYIKAN